MNIFEFEDKYNFSFTFIIVGQKMIKFVNLLK